MAAVRITHFSDVLCIWAYVGHRRLEELAEQFGDQIEIETRYCSVFPDAWGKIETKWAERGGFGGFNTHLQAVAARFPHVPVHAGLWAGDRPRSSGSPHLFLKAIELIEQDDGVDAMWADRLSTQAAWAVRRGFFEDARDISDWSVLEAIAAERDIDPDRINDKIRSSEAVTQLAIDYHAASEQGIAGSPTLVLNKGRQKLFGNVGYRLIEANVMELLRGHPEDEASWC
jgi:predicted DsbA family dithiol-disulfide isomerase